MGKILGFYCPYCGKEYLSYHESTACSNCASLLFAKYDYFPGRKLKSVLREYPQPVWERYKELLPDFKAVEVSANTYTSLVKINNDSGAEIFIKNEAENTSGSYAERGLALLFPVLRNKKIIGGIFPDSAVYSAIFLRTAYNMDIKIMVPEFIGEKNINKLFKLTDNIDVIEGDDNFLKLFSLTRNAVLNSFNYFEYLEGLKIIFFEIVAAFDLKTKINMVIPLHRFDLILAWAKAMQELKLLDAVKQSNITLHSFIVKETMNFYYTILLKQFKKQIVTAIKESKGTIMEVSGEELSLDSMKKNTETGLLLCNDAKLSLVVADLLTAKNKIGSKEKIVVINGNHAALDMYVAGVN